LQICQSSSKASAKACKKRPVDKADFHKGLSEVSYQGLYRKLINCRIRRETVTVQDQDLRAMTDT